MLGLKIKNNFLRCVRSVTTFVGFLLKLLRILGKENYLQILMIMITV